MVAGPINTFRTVEKVTLEDVVGEAEEDADFEPKETISNNSDSHVEVSDKNKWNFSLYLLAKYIKCALALKRCWTSHSAKAKRGKSRIIYMPLLNHA